MKGWWSGAVTWVTPEANWWPLIGLVLFVGVGALVVEFLPERRTPDQIWMDDMARARRRWEKRMEKRRWAR